MQGDMEFINTILQGIASKPVTFVGVGNLAHERKTAVALGLDPTCWPEASDDILWLGNTQEEIEEHLRLLVKAGFLQEGGVT